MNIVDLLSSPWAIVPERLLEMQSIYARHFHGDELDVDAIEARLGRPLANEQQDYTVGANGIAVLNISGAIAPKMNLMTKISGGATASLLQKQVDSMAADPRVRGAVLAIDSPGGNVLGIPALADAVRALSATKPTVAVCDGMMCSAAYWVGSAANAVYVSGTTDSMGSIGVVATHQYRPSGAVQTTEITAGKYKRMASGNAPLDAEGRAYLQEQVDHIYSVFVDAVAENRGVSVEDVLKRMADGRVFIGQQAVDAGLADGIATVDAIIERMAEDPSMFARNPSPPVAMSASDFIGGTAAATTDEDTSMTPQEIAAAFAAENAEAAALIRAEGAEAERARIADVRAQSLPGHEDLIETLAFDGKSTGAEAAQAVLAAERELRRSAAATRAADAPAPVVQADAEDEAPAEGTKLVPAGNGMMINTARAELHKKALAYQAAHPGTDYVSAVKAVEMEG